MRPNLLVRYAISPGLIKARSPYHATAETGLCEVRVAALRYQLTQTGLESSRNSFVSRVSTPCESIL
jgi:hypothetical protein